MSDEIKNRSGFKLIHGNWQNPAKNRQSKERNAARREYRKANPQHRGKQLNHWPL